MFTREKKIFMIVGFVTILGVSVLFVDHFSGASRNSPAGPLDADPLLSNGLVISVLPGNETRHHTTAPDPFRDAIGNGIDRIARGGEDLIDSAGDQINDLRDRVNPAPAAGTQNNTTADEPPMIKMGAPVEEDDNGQIIQLPEVRIHRVAAGDTLWRIAEQYYGDASLHSALAEYNTERLTAAGQPRAGATVLIPPRALLVPGAAPTVAVTTPNTRPVSQPQPQRPTETATRTYEVKRGDTLAHISQRELGTANRWQEIMALNADRIEDPSDIWVGMKIKLPGQPQSPRSTDAAARTYEVKRGDTLSQISQRELGTATRWKEIMDLNADRLKEPTDIWVGMKIKLPAR